MMIPQIVRSLAAEKLRSLLWLAPLISVLLSAPHNSAAADDQPVSAQSTSIPGAALTTSGLSVTNFAVSGFPELDAASVNKLLSKYKGTSAAVTDLVKAAVEVQAECERRGRAGLSVAIQREATTNGTVTLNLFSAVMQQILISGKRYVLAEGEAKLATAQDAIAASATHAPSSAAKATATNAPSAATSAPVQKFKVIAYEVRGDTLLSTETLTSILKKYTGTNIGVAEILKAGSELQMEYRARGYPTVSVTIPPQQITNGIVKLRIFEGRLANIEVENNRFFSSNNIMRALPSLQTNMILNKEVFQTELDRANMNQDRQIYPELLPGPEENTTTLLLKVKDRLPLHAKVEFSNQSSPGTPDLRINTSAAYNNLWQIEHMVGAQYSFSPEQFKPGDQWNLYDSPLVANYSGFYRFPLGNPENLGEVASSKPGNFGYDEASRRFVLPQGSGRTELTIYGSRSTIDTGLEVSDPQLIYNVPGVRQIIRQDVQEDLTLNEGLGTRLTTPFFEAGNVRSMLSFGLDYKHYDITSNKTNNFTFYEITLDQNNHPNPPIISRVPSVVPTTHYSIGYFPLALRWDANERDASGVTQFGMGFGMNFWYTGGRSNLQAISGSSKSTGNWLTTTFNVTRDQSIFTNWVLTLHADAQAATEPLISNEQFGLGGLAGVRGYREGEVFGDSGWRVTLEQKTPPHVVGMAYAKAPLTVRGSVFMDYGEVYLLDPHAASGRTALWGIGFGAVASVGSHFDARLLVSWPLLRTTTTEAGQPRFDFALTAQF